MHRHQWELVDHNGKLHLRPHQGRHRRPLLRPRHRRLHRQPARPNPLPLPHPEPHGLRLQSALPLRLTLTPYNIFIVKPYNIVILERSEGSASAFCCCLYSCINHKAIGCPIHRSLTAMGGNVKRRQAAFGRCLFSPVVRHRPPNFVFAVVVGTPVTPALVKVPSLLTV